MNDLETMSEISDAIFPDDIAPAIAQTAPTSGHGKQYYTTRNLLLGSGEHPAGSLIEESHDDFEYLLSKGFIE